MAHLSRYSEKMDVNTYFITLTQKLESKHWELINGGELMPMSWGSATIYVWKKIKPPNKEIGDPAAELAAAEKEKEKKKKRKNFITPQMSYELEVGPCHLSSDNKTEILLLK